MSTPSYRGSKIMARRNFQKFLEKPVFQPNKKLADRLVSKSLRMYIHYILNHEKI